MFTKGTFLVYGLKHFTKGGYENAQVRLTANFGSKFNRKVKNGKN